MLFCSTQNIAKKLEIEKKVLVKTFSNELLNKYLRVSVGSKAAMSIFLGALLDVDN